MSTKKFPKIPRILLILVLNLTFTKSRLSSITPSKLDNAQFQTFSYC